MNGNITKNQYCYAKKITLIDHDDVQTSIACSVSLMIHTHLSDKGYYLIPDLQNPNPNLPIKTSSLVLFKISFDKVTNLIGG